MPFAEQQLGSLSLGQPKAAIANALQGVGAFAPFAEGAEAVGQGIGALGTAQAQAAGAGFTPSSYQQFMDPFTESVIAQTQADIARQGAIQQGGIEAKLATSEHWWI